MTPPDQRPILNQRLRHVLQSIYSLTPELREIAITALIREALAMEQALRFYADPQNWLDGVPMTERQGPSTEEDCGFEARWALHLVDLSYGTYLRIPQEEIDALKSPVSAGDVGRGSDAADEKRADALDTYPVWQRLPDGDDSSRN